MMPISFSAVLSGGLPKKQAIDTEWYCPLPAKEKQDFINRESLKIAQEHNCDLICVRSDMHNTTGALIPLPFAPPGRPGPNNGRGRKNNTVTAMPAIQEQAAYTLPNAKIVSRPSKPKVFGKMEKVYVEAPWHYTVEFRRKDGSWFSAHVYTDTKPVADKYGKKRMVTTGLAEIKGIIEQNPQIWQQKGPGHNGEKTYETRFTVPEKGELSAPKPRPWPKQTQPKQAKPKGWW